MDPFNPADVDMLGPDGLPLNPKRPMPPQAPPPQQDNGSLLGDGAEAGFDAVDVVNDVAEGGILSGLGDVISGAADLAGSAISGTADAMSGVASGAADLAGSALSGVASGAGTIASGAVDVLGTVASGAGEVISTVASNIPDALSTVGDGLGTVVEGAASAGDGCGSCSLAIVLFFLAAGSAVAAVIR
jgi:phage-related protein